MEQIKQDLQEMLDTNDLEKINIIIKNIIDLNIMSYDEKINALLKEVNELINENDIILANKLLIYTLEKI